ncbi:tripartite ATP-independent transporter DctM subunit [Rhizobium sp. BK313]|uniref:TRAP transporter large permease n=1 Tax=Rhizobium sp. BK313 TaxID=2587081 RepID=UPI00105DE9EF|nr:TRAP transporter large permease subunit [Rhizobium sp. BK313]MBB3458705.1 tripartite ATP-independent transporter DctM subunit [Rhizobium sp. BK313]
MTLNRFSAKDESTISGPDFETLGLDIARHRFRRPLDAFALSIEVFVVLALIVNIVVTFSNTMLRFILGQDLPWAADVSTLLLSIITFLGAPAFMRRASGMAYMAVIDQMTGFPRDLLRSCGYLFVIALCVLSLSVFPAFFAAQVRQVLPVLQMSLGTVAIWLGIGLVLTIVYTLEKLWDVSGAALGAALAVTVSLGALVLLLRSGYYSGALELDPFLPILGFLILAFVAGTPIPFILASGGALYFVMTGDAPLVGIPSAYQYGISSFVLLAIPFFMVAGSLMDVTGMARKLIDMVQEWVGHWKGGLLIAEILATYVFSGVSGSKAADIATVGAVMKIPMRERNYPSTEFVAVLAASAAMSETIPPSVAMLILGSVTSLSVGALFVAGFLPAAILAIALIIGVVLRGRTREWPAGVPFNLRRAARSIPPALPALGVPVIVIGGLLGGVASPTESSSFAVVYGFAAAFIFYRSVGLASCWRALREAALVAGMVLLMVAMANLMVQAIVVDGLGATMVSLFSKAVNPTIFLFVSVAALIVIGFVLEGFPAILISAPILLPLAVKLGVDPLQFGILIIMATGIGVMMPPIGIGFYIACTVGEAPINATMRSSMYYNAFLLMGVVVVILFPQITTWLPSLFGMH